MLLRRSEIQPQPFRAAYSVFIIPEYASKPDLARCAHALLVLLATPAADEPAEPASEQTGEPPEAA